MKKCAPASIILRLYGHLPQKKDTMEEIPVRYCLLCFAAIFHFDCDFAIRRPAVRPSLASSDYYCTSGPRPPHTPTSGRRLKSQILIDMVISGRAVHRMFLNLMKIVLVVHLDPKSLLEVIFWHLVTEKVAI